MTTEQQGTMISPGTMDAPKTLLVKVKMAEQATQQEQLIAATVVERLVTALEGYISRSSGSTGTDSGVNSAGGHPPTPLTRDDIPALVREISCQLRPDNSKVHTPLVPGTRCCVSRVPLLGTSKGPVIDDTPGLGVHWSCG